MKGKAPGYSPGVFYTEERNVIPMKDSITTYTKKQFTPLDPREEDIDIRDIAHALSLMTRANGHFPEFYSDEMNFDMIWCKTSHGIRHNMIGRMRWYDTYDCIKQKMDCQSACV